MPTQTRQLYEFGPFRLDVSERLLLRDGRIVPLSPKVFDTLLVLVENSGRILGKDELMQTIWPDTFVEESNLTHNISQIRRALGEGEYIETIPRRGYRFVFHVQTVSREAQDVGTVEARNGLGEDMFSLANGNGSTDGVIAAMVNQPLEIADHSASTQTYPGAFQPDVVATRTLNSKRVMMLSGFLFAGLSIIVVLLFVASRPANNHARTAFRQIGLAKLTTVGEPRQSAISHDGKYIAYVEKEGDRQSLWIRQVASTSGAQVVAPAEVVFNGVTFTIDDNFLYYVARPKEEPVGRLYQIPVLGGAPKQLMSGVDTAITFSPDGMSLAFIRNDQEHGEMSLITARLDGSGERQLLRRKRPEMLSWNAPSWSPDGKVIACPAGSWVGVESTMRILAVKVIDGSAQPIGDRTWSFIGQVAWLGDGSGVVFHAWSRLSAVYGDPLWLLTYPKGQARPITNDLTNYEGVSLSADSKALVTHRMDRVSRIWIVPLSGGDVDIGQAKQIQSGFGDNFSEWLGLDWMPDGRLVYASQAGGNLELWTVTLDGQQQRQLTRDAQTDMLPATSAQARYIVFVSDRSGHSNIWRMDLDGGNPKQVTRGRGDFAPSLSPDGRWVVYSSWTSGEETLWKAPIDGGEPVQLTRDSGIRPAVSPDGNWIAYSSWDGKRFKNRVAILPFAGGEPRFIAETAQPEYALVRWSPDSRALTYIVTREGVSNIWSQPLDGSVARQLTGFTTDRIFRFAWSPDGKHLACERGLAINEMVLIRSGKSE